ncbi:MAG: DUF4347 domain-containing protein [Myxacorys chilensis ATA2-1-KO14]|nr:DUF4347 domain-containing protein [Myxacorys chilensis ATA2-1-KO14]
MNSLSGIADLSDPLSVELAPRQALALDVQSPSNTLTAFRSARSVSPSPTQTPSAPSSTPRQTVDEILFIDKKVPGYQQLESGTRSGVTIIELNPNQDGIAQISNALAQFQIRKAVHVVSLGDKGVVKLGAAQLSKSSIGLYASDLRSWAKSFNGGVDILMYGSNVGADRALLEQVSALTGADVAASSDRTGSSTLGGDWDLEQKVLRVNTGAIATQLAFQPSTLQTYAATLSA